MVRAAVRPENRRDCNFLGLCFHRSNYSPDAGKPLRSFPGWSFARQTRDGRINMRLGVHEIFCAVDKNMPRRDYRGIVAGDRSNIGDWPLARYLEQLDALATMIGNFQDGLTPGKLQFESGWWFSDQKEAMEWQMNALSNVGLLSRFVGMLTDSRSFIIRAMNISAASLQ